MAIVRILLALAICWQSAIAQDFAFTNVGGSGRSDSPGFVRNVPAHGGFSGFAREIGPKVKAGGFTRLWIHNPGGLWPHFHPFDDSISVNENRANATADGYGDTRLMWVHQWLVAKAHKLSWADPLALKAFHYQMRADYGVEEIVYYFGGPYVMPPAVQKAALADFVHLDGASFGFDHVVTNREFAACQELWKWIDKENPQARIYTEARPFEGISGKLTKHCDGTVATAGFDLNHPVGSKPETQERAKKIGEVIRIVDKDAQGNYPAPVEGVTFAKRGALR